METIHNRVTASKEIKKILSRRWPLTKFSVKSESYSGGSSINIYWELGPTREQVEAIANKYQEGSFDGMTDCYDYDPTLVLTQDNQIKRLGGAKFVFCNRSEGDGSLRKQYSEDVCKEQGVVYAGDMTVICGDRWERHLTVGDQFYQAFSKCDFHGKQYDGIEPDSGSCANCFYSIKTKNA